MQVKAEIDADTANALAQQIGETIRRDPEFTQGEILLACMIVIGGVLQSIKCRNCRKSAAKSVKKIMPRIIRDTLVQATQHESDHVH